MSDSDDDWFDKDIEDFKVDLPKDNSEKIEFLNDESVSSGGPNFFESGKKNLIENKTKAERRI